MQYANVILDIPTREIDRSYSYGIPDHLKERISVGVAVLVSFAHRMAVAYVVNLSENMPQNISAERLLFIEQVLTDPLFNIDAVITAKWIAKEYACSPISALKLFLPPGLKLRAQKKDKNAPWQLIFEKSAPIDVRWVCLTSAAKDFVPRKNASRQRQVLSALKAGDMRLAELCATIPGAASAVKALEEKEIVRVSAKRLIRTIEDTSLSSASAPRPQLLTDGQKEALAAIDKAQSRAAGDVLVIDGVTGSGKTEVYLAAIEKAIAAGKTALVLVPEISLTAQTVGRFRSRFGDDVAVLHSKLSNGQRFDQWDMARKGLVHVVVGARSALFAPLSQLGLIIIDEEHESSYKQSSEPRYHAREVAAYMAEIKHCALVLGSATPSFESLERTYKGSFRGHSWQRLKMSERPGQAQFPSVQIVDMTLQFSQGRKTALSAPLVDALLEVFKKKQKAVLFLNRRGFANFLMCRECGCVPECPHCSCSLTYHERTHELICHSCGRSWPFRAWPDPSVACPHCGSRYVGAYGIGTQRIEDELHILIEQNGYSLQDIEVIRMDADTTKAKDAHQKLLERFDSARCAVLLGTQMIAKGLDFPEVTLVGVINADTTLKLPDFRAAERTHALLEQVAGRAGRGDLPGHVIIQSYWATHLAIASVATNKTDAFIKAELADRKECYYPPFSRLSNVIVWGKDKELVRRITDEIASRLKSAIDKEPTECGYWELVGPAACIKERIKDMWRRHLFVKSPLDSTPAALIVDAVRATHCPRGISVAIDIDAFDLI